MLRTEKFDFVNDLKHHYLAIKKTEINALKEKMGKGGTAGRWKERRSMVNAASKLTWSTMSRRGGNLAARGDEGIEEK